MTNDASEGELPQFSIEELLQEVVDIHADKDSPDYNECDQAKCAWCESALVHIEAQRKGLTRDEVEKLVDILQEYGPSEYDLESQVFISDIKNRLGM